MEQLSWFGWQFSGLCGFSCFWDPTWARGGQGQAGGAGAHLKSPWWCWSAFPAKLSLFPQNQGDFWAGESRAVPCGAPLSAGEEEQFVVRSSWNSQGILVQILPCHTNSWGVSPRGWFHREAESSRASLWLLQHSPCTLETPKPSGPHNHCSHSPCGISAHLHGIFQIPNSHGSWGLQRAPSLLFPVEIPLISTPNTPFWEPRDLPLLLLVALLCTLAGACCSYNREAFCASPDKFFVGATPAKSLMCWGERSPKECPCLSSEIGAKSCSPPKITPLKSAERLAGTGGDFGHWNMKVNFTS